MPASTSATSLVDPDDVALSAAGRRAGWRDRIPRERLALGAITLAALAFYLYHAFADQALYRTTGYDLGIFDQAVRAYAHFQSPMVPLKGSGYDILGDHFHPILVVLAPFYWVWNSLGVLLIAQAVLTAVSIPVVYRFTRRRTGAVFALVVSATYAFGWPLQGLIDFDFHEIAFATPLAALAIDALDRRDDRRLVLWCALLVLVREDMGLLVALMGLLVLAQRRAARRLGYGMVVAGGLAYYIATSVIIPHFSAGHAFAYGNQFGALGSSVGDAAVNAITHPWRAVRVFFTPARKTATLALLLVPFALVPLRSPYFVLALPLFAERFFNSRSNLWTATFHYNALPWLILTLAMVDGAQRFGLFEQERRARILRSALAGFLVAVPILLIFIGDSVKVVPITSLRKAHADQPPAWVSHAEAVVAFLPHNVCVVADNNLVPHLTDKDWTTVAEANTRNADFYALDMSAPDTGGNPPAPKPGVVYNEAMAMGYQPVLVSGTFIVLQAPHYTGPSSACRPLGPGK